MTLRCRRAARPHSDRRTPIEYRRFCFALLLIVTVIFVRPAWAQDARTVWLLHAEVAPAARPLHEHLEAGVRDAIRGTDIELREVRVDASDWNVRLAKERPVAIIALEPVAYEQARKSYDARRIVAAGVELPVGEGSGVWGITTAASPQHVFNTLQQVRGSTERVHVVIEPSRRKWWGPLAERAGRASGIDLVFYDATSINDGAVHFWNILRYANPRRDALWLLDGTNFVTRDGTLPRIIEESWSREFLVFSSVLEHVRQGALFGVFPKPRELGRGLGEIARSIADGPRTRPTVVFMDQLGEAINLRVAAHMKIELGAQRRSEFEVLVGTDR